MYHSREGSEHQMLRQRIDVALRDDESRLEVEMVRRTLADVHREEVTLAERKRALVELLRLRFKSLPAETEQVIQTTQDADQLAEDRTENEDLREIEMIRRTVENVHREECLLAERKRLLLELVHLRFKCIPLVISERIVTTQDPDWLALLLRRFATAKNLDALGMTASR
jgi:hypothetical protein